MIKAFVGRKAYYIFKKSENKPSECLKAVATETKNTQDQFVLMEAKALDDIHYEIGSKGKFWAITRK